MVPNEGLIDNTPYLGNLTFYSRYKLGMGILELFILFASSLRVPFTEIHLHFLFFCGICVVMEFYFHSKKMNRA